MRLTSTRPMDGMATSRMKTQIVSKIQAAKDHHAQMLSKENHETAQLVAKRIAQQEELLRHLFDEEAQNG